MTNNRQGKRHKKKSKKNAKSTKQDSIPLFHIPKQYPKIESRDIICITLLLLLASIFFWKVIIFPNHMIYNVCYDLHRALVCDIYATSYPWLTFINNVFESGNLPIWNPYTFGGEPFIANPQTAIFYPISTILLFILPKHLAIGYGVLIHVFLAGLFMYLLVRYIGLKRVSSLISAIVFMFGPFIISHTGVPPLIHTVAWVPLIFLLFTIALDRQSWQWGIVVAIFLAIQFLAGQTQIFLYTVFLLFVYLLFRLYIVLRETKWDIRDKRCAIYIAMFILILTISTLLSAVQFFPSLELSEYTIRSEWTYKTASYDSFPPKHAITFLLPWFFGNPVDGVYWGEPSYGEVSAHIGIFTIVLVLLSIVFRRKNRYVQFFSVLMCLSLLLALGKYTHIYGLLWEYIPYFDMFRAPGRFLLLFTFSVSILSGFGYNFLAGTITPDEKLKIWKFVKVLSMLTILLIGVIVATYHFDGYAIQICKEAMVQKYYDYSFMMPLDHYLQQANLIYSTILKDMYVLLFLSVVTMLIITLRIKERIHVKHLSIIVILFVFSFLCFYNMGFVDCRNINDIYYESEPITFLKNDQEIKQGLYRVFNFDFRGKGKPSEEEVIRELSGNTPIVHGIYGLNGDTGGNLIHYDEIYNHIQRLENNTNHPVLNLLNVKYILTKTQLNNSGFELVFNKDDVYIYENKQVLPKAFIVYETDKPVHSKLRIKKYSSNEIIIETDITDNCILVLSEIWYPSWKAYIDNKPIDIQKRYTALMSVHLEKGQYEIRFTHESSSLRKGIWVTFSTIACLFIITVGTVWSRRRLKKK